MTALTLFGAWRLVDVRSFLNGAERVEARVVAQIPWMPGQKLTISNDYTLGFSATDGRAFRANLNSFATYEVDDAVWIAYRPEAPHRIREASFGRTYAFPLLLGAIGASGLFALVRYSLLHGRGSSEHTTIHVDRRPQSRAWKEVERHTELDGPVRHTYARRESGGTVVEEFTMETTIDSASHEDPEELLGAFDLDALRRAARAEGERVSHSSSFESRSFQSTASDSAAPVAESFESESFVYDPEAAAAFIWQRLPQDVKRCLSRRDVDRILDLELQYQEKIGLVCDGPSDTPPDDADLPVLDMDEVVRFVRQAAAAAGAPLSDEAIEAVLDAEIEYLDAQQG